MILHVGHEGSIGWNWSITWPILFDINIFGWIFCHYYVHSSGWTVKTRLLYNVYFSKLTYRNNAPVLCVHCKTLVTISDTLCLIPDKRLLIRINWQQLTHISTCQDTIATLTFRDSERNCIMSTVICDSDILTKLLPRFVITFQNRWLE